MPGKTAIEAIAGDITRLNVDAVVNAANSSLLGGGGVDGAIHRAGGKAIREACMKIREAQGGCKTGEAVITTAGNLPSKFVIHTVGPVWNGGSRGEDVLLASCYSTSLTLASDNDIRSIAFPNISTGIYGFPKERAAEIAVRTVLEEISRYPELTQLYFVCFDPENLSYYQKLLKAGI